MKVFYLLGSVTMCGRSFEQKELRRVALRRRLILNMMAPSLLKFIVPL